jgi:hypothetical protein
VFRPHLCNLLVAGVFTAALLSGPGCGQGKEGEKDKGVAGKPGGKGDPGTPPKADLGKAKADFTTDAESWHAEWAKDREAASTKYKGKTVELSGVVDHPSDDPYCRVGFIYLKIKGDGIGPRCALDDPAPWLKVGPGCKVKIKGIVPEFGSGGGLESCVIVESSPNTCQEITAVQLAKEFAADKKAAEDKYRDKCLIVEGELTGKEPSEIDKGRFVYLMMKGDGGIGVKGYVGNDTEERKKANDDLKAGQKIKICGEARLDLKGKDLQISAPGGRRVTLSK